MNAEEKSKIQDPRSNEKPSLKIQNDAVDQVEPLLNLSSRPAGLALGSWSLSDVWFLDLEICFKLGVLNFELRPVAPSLGCPPNT